MAKSPRPRKTAPADPTPPTPQTDPVVGAPDQPPSAAAASVPGKPAPKPARVARKIITPDARRCCSGELGSQAATKKTPAVPPAVRKPAVKKAAAAVPTRRQRSPRRLRA